MAKPPGKRGRKQADSDDSDSDATPSKGTTTGGFKNRDTIDLRIAVDQDSLDCEKKGLPSWKNAHAGASSVPPRHICVTCGFFGDYKCVQCVSKRTSRLSTYYCSARCYEVHKDHNCGKNLNLTHW